MNVDALRIFILNTVSTFKLGKTENVHLMAVMYVSCATCSLWVVHHCYIA